MEEKRSSGIIMDDKRIATPFFEEGSLYLSKREVDALEECCDLVYEADGTENIAIHGRELAAVVEYILQTKKIKDLTGVC
jgi:hypothetical protein